MFDRSGTQYSATLNLDMPPISYKRSFFHTLVPAIRTKLANHSSLAIWSIACFWPPLNVANLTIVIIMARSVWIWPGRYLLACSGCCSRNWPKMYPNIYKKWVTEYLCQQNGITISSLNLNTSDLQSDTFPVYRIKPWIQLNLGSQVQYDYKWTEIFVSDRKLGRSKESYAVQGWCLTSA